MKKYAHNTAPELDCNIHGKSGERRRVKTSTPCDLNSRCKRMQEHSATDTNQVRLFTAPSYNPTVCMRNGCAKIGYIFKPCRFKSRDRQKSRINIESEQVEWQVSFRMETSTKKFVSGLFDEQVFNIGYKQSVAQFRVEQIEALHKMKNVKNTHATVL